MIRASELKAGTVLKKGNDFLKVVSIDFTGAAKSERSLRVKLKNLLKGNVVDAHYKADDPLEEADLTTTNMEFLYEDGDNLVFMDQESFEQVTIPLKQIGNAKAFLKENMQVPVQLYEGNPVHVLFPSSVEMEVTQAAPGTSQTDSTFKEVEIENGMKIKAPQFIKQGDRIHVDVETGRYLDRVKKAK